jgi:SAM-dependent methyltransferase
MTGPSPMFLDTFFRSYCGRPALRRINGCSTLLLVPGSRPKPLLPWSAQGHVTATDFAPAMVNRARQRLAASPNASVMVEDGQSLRFDEGSFDAVLCSLGLMFFPDPARGLSEFHRVLRPGGYAAASVLTTPERSYNGRINVLIGRRVPSLAEATARTFALGDEARLRSLFKQAGFRDVKTTTEAHSFVLPSFEAYFEPFEQGGASTGQAYLTLSAADRQAVRDEVRRSLVIRADQFRSKWDFGLPADVASDEALCGRAEQRAAPDRSPALLGSGW